MSKRSPNTPITGHQKKLKKELSLGSQECTGEGQVANRFQQQLFVVQVELDRLRTLNKFLEWERSMQAHH